LTTNLDRLVFSFQAREGYNMNSPKMNWDRVCREARERSHGVDWISYRRRFFRWLGDEADDESDNTVWESLSEAERDEIVAKLMSETRGPEWKNPLEREQEDVWLPNEDADDSGYNSQ
jgi:hypothetical protein